MSAPPVGGGLRRRGRALAMAELPGFRQNVSRNRGLHEMAASSGSRKHVMPLRARLIALVGVMLLASLACGSALIVWRAAKSVQTELRAAIDVSVQTTRNGF